MISTQRSRSSESTRGSRPLVLTGGGILDPSQNIDEPGDLLVQNGKGEAVGGRGGHSDGPEVIDCAGCIGTTGFNDGRCHLREQGREGLTTIAASAPRA